MNITDIKELEKNPEIVGKLEKRIQEMLPGKSKDLIKAIWKCLVDNEYYFEYFFLHLEYGSDSYDHFNNLHNAYQSLCGYTANTCRTLDDFFCPKFFSALKSFLGEDEASHIREECELMTEFPYSHTSYRPSYRSCQASTYINIFFMIIINAIHFACYGLTMEQVLTAKDREGSTPEISNRIALALRHHDKNVFDLIKEAILGDNNLIQMSNMLISSIVKSGDLQALELLGKLLLAAKGQEGLRQAILETCDSGTLDSHIYFIRLILENGLCRFSSVVRAFDTWSGLGFGDQKQKVAEKCMSLALKYLSDESAIEAGLNSNDTTEIYLALWALSCRDAIHATQRSKQLLNSPEKYKRLVGWYFITHTNSDYYRHETAAEYLDILDPEELAWVCTNLHQNDAVSGSEYEWYDDNDILAYHGFWNKKCEQAANEKTYFDEIYPENKDGRTALFNQIVAIMALIGKKNTKFTKSVFPWYEIELNVSIPCQCLLGLAAYDRSAELTNQLADYLSQMNSEQRFCFYSRLLNPNNPEQRVFMLEGLSDRSKTIKERIVERLSFYSLNETDAEYLAKTLTTRNADLRKGIITLFAKQKETFIRPIIDSLLKSQDENQFIAGSELLDIFSQKNPALKNEYRDKISSLTKNEDFLKHVIPNTNKNNGNEYTLENGYKLFNPAHEIFDCKKYQDKRPAIPMINDSSLKALIVPDEKAVFALYDRIADVFEQNKNYEYETENWNGTREKVLLSNNDYYVYLLAGQKRHSRKHLISDYPLSDEWLTAAGEYSKDKTKLVAVLSMWSNCFSPGYEKWFRNIFDGYPVNGEENKQIKRIKKHIESKGVTCQKMNEILEAILNTDEQALFEYAFSAYVNLIRKIPEEKLGSKYEKETKDRFSCYNPPDNKIVLQSEYLSYWRHLAYEHIKTDVQFTTYFLEMWYQCLAAGRQTFYGLYNEDIFRAYEMGLIPDDAVYMYFMSAVDAPEHMQAITGSYNDGREILEKYPAAKKLLGTAIDRMITIEENRGELPTSLTRVAAHINRFDGGIQHFVSLLAALGNAGFHRGYSYYFLDQGELTKKEGLSQLLRGCQPTCTDTPDTLRKTLKAAGISEKRIIQVAVYAPQWAKLLEQAMSIPGLECGVRFFHAHVNEDFSAEKETETAIFSAITPQQFNDGAFDKDWFLEAYHALGEKRFNELYKNAKYITQSNIAHRRSQLYTDAVVGRMDKDTTKAEIIDKRNQEKLRAFALIPMDEKNKNDALQRYEYIQQFKKESRQFGSQRQASENKACQIAMENLAITTGYSDVDRMTWALEGEKIEQLRPLFEPYTIGDTEVWLSIEACGTPGLNIRKNNKVLKALPKSLSKESYVLELKEAIKQLRNQKQRARFSFEAAMISRAEFSIAEISGLLNHPILKSMVSSLVFVSGVYIGFPSLINGKLNLVDATEEHQQLKGKNKLTIAHPYDFVSRKNWSSYQRYSYKNKIVQPFKQVFREYYPVTEDELAAISVSNRYAGNQIQPRKAAMLLKTRGWTVDYEEGLQRVWHKENLIVRIYALADWFSPAEIEAPTLETMQFFSRHKQELVPFTDIPPVIFSEAMRDIDLAVSVAHAGGVDPEASHSTIEMRIAIAKELLSLLSVKNVIFQTAHAQITGSLGEYSVHMGSGIVHKSGTGMLSVLPVHSQARGRIFLPFVDDDPKTAEILSKILLFADDKKIKDPGILSQMKG